MKKAVITFLMAAVILPLAAWGQGFKNLNLPDTPTRNANLVAGLMQIVTAKADIQTAPAGNKCDMAPTATRGGGGSPFHPKLGCYIGANDVEFKSDYKDLDPQTMANWAYDLSVWMGSHGGGWDNYLRYQRETPVSGSDVNNILSRDLSAASGNPQPDAWDRSFIPYAKQREFAELYWDHYSEKFRHTPSMFRDWFLNDAILDGNNIYLEYQQRLGGKGSADFVSYKDATLAQLLKRK